MKKFYYIMMASIVMNFTFECYPLSDFAREKGFVYLHEVDPTIRDSLRYCTLENFVGKRVKGYAKPFVIMTNQAAQALKKVQEELQKDGYSLVVYDAYRPQQAVNHFIEWSEDQKDQNKKQEYYPVVDKKNVFDLGYVARRSGHSRGSTIDLTIIENGKQVEPIKRQKRILLDGREILFLNDGTVDMGSSFDLFDLASHPDSNLVEQKYTERRIYLKNIMEKHGFIVSPREWWHYTLKDEPYPARKDSSYFDFVIE